MRIISSLCRSNAWALVLLGAAAGCVQSRPARNGVFNENQYVRKSFLVAPGDGSQADPGWMLRASVTAVSTPNPLGGDIGIYPGTSNQGDLVRFVVTEDRIQLVSQREITDVPSDQRTPEVVNAWGITNVDLKYRVNLDGENTNFFEENQELDWQQRQWVKVKFAKNDMSDVAPLGSFATYALNTCTDAGNASATLVTDSFIVDEKNNYLEWTVQVTLPVKFDDPACVQAYGDLGIDFAKLGRTNVTFNLKYSLMRAVAAKDITYSPLVVDEKDPIRRKYGIFDYTSIVRDDDSGNLAARQMVMRFDPKKPIKWYFAHGFRDDYKPFFHNPKDRADPTTIEGQTNALLKDVGVDVSSADTGGVSFHEYDEADAGATACTSDADCSGPTYHCNSAALCAPQRAYGDVRYNMLVWMNDRDTQASFAGVTGFITDPRTGETLTAQILLNDFSIKDYYVQRIDAYLQSIGASDNINGPDPWADLGPCVDGDVKGIDTTAVQMQHNANSSVYAKMQQYLQKPQAQYGNLGPADFIAGQDADFFKAYFAIMPYLVFADPDANQFVIREGGQGVYGPGDFFDRLREEADFQKAAASIDRGEPPYDVTSIGAGANWLPQATSFLSQFQNLTRAHEKYLYTRDFTAPRRNQHFDGPESFSLEAVIAKDSRHCINGKWETKDEWITNLISTYWSQVAWHEFGHSLGLEHNFMGSVDRPNFPTYKDASMRDHFGMYSSSVMEYNSAPDRVFWKAGWGPYDQGAIAWTYGNSKADLSKGQSTSLSGQLSATQPWVDPHGFNKDGTEITYMFCTHQHLLYTPLCRQGDLGTTPSEIIANQIDNYEWRYQWSNFRQYRKFWDNSAYANVPASMIVDMRRFMSLWIFDWGNAELADTFRRIGITNPDPMGSQLEYYQQLTNKFNLEASAANQMVGAFHKAIIQQSSGERPYKTVYDKYFGDVTQQGIILDKLFAMQGWVALWPTDNYDPNQAGFYLAAYEGLGDSSYNFIAEDTVTSMIGGQYDVYPYFVPLAVAQFAQDTHSPSFFGRTEIRDWIGGQVFDPPFALDGFLTYFREIAVQNNLPGCPDLDTCKYDPRDVSDTHNEFLGPDKRVWSWVYVIDRNQYIAVQKDRNIATYILMRNYTDDVITRQDDGAYPGGAYGNLLPLKYTLDAFRYFN